MGSFYLTDQLIEDGVCLVSVGGYVDFDVAPRLKKCLVQRIQDGVRLLLIDLSEAGFIDSTAIGVLVGALKRLRESDGALGVICANQNVTSIFEVVGLENVIPLYRSQEDALASLAQPA